MPTPAHYQLAESGGRRKIPAFFFGFVAAYSYLCTKLGVLHPISNGKEFENYRQPPRIAGRDIMYKYHDGAGSSGYGGVYRTYGP
jgi:hypothetical protein